MTRIRIKSRSGKHSAEVESELFHEALARGIDAKHYLWWSGGEDGLRQAVEHNKLVEASNKDMFCDLHDDLEIEKTECSGCGLWKCAECELDHSSSQEGGWWCVTCVVAGKHQNSCDGCGENFDHDELSGIPTPWGANDFCDECKREYYHRAGRGFFSAASCDGFRKTCTHRSHEQYDPDCELCEEEREEETDDDDDASPV